MTNHRLTFAAGVAVAASSLSMYAVLHGNSWMVAGLGAIAVVGLAGTLTRLATIPAAIAAAITVLVAALPPLAGAGWLGVAGALALVGLAAASATGARPLRAFAVLATYCGCLLIYLNLIFASSASYLWIIPSARSVSLLAGLPGKATPQFAFSPPIPATKPVDLLAAAGIGAIAIIVDFLAVRLRRPALACLPLLVLFSVPVASNLKGFGINQSLTFGAGIAAYLALLSTDGLQRLRMWGRLVTVRRVHPDETGTGPDTRDLAATGRRIGLAAVCLAIVVPLALPGHKPHDVFAKTRSGGLPGGQAQAGALSPLLGVQPQLKRKTPVPVLSYTTTALNPQQQYLQEYVLNYNPVSNQWLTEVSGLQPVSGQQLPGAVPGLARGTAVSKVTTTIDLTTANDQAPLPMPYAPVRIADPKSSMSEAAGSLMVYDTQQLEHMHYTVISREADPSQADLSSQSAVSGAIDRAYGTYNGPDSARLLAIAQQITAGDLTPLQEAVSLQNWFTSTRFSYTLSPNLPNSPGWLLKFLTTRRHGNCQQFAPAFAVLARLLAIPSRVAVGYTAGAAPTGGQSTWQVTSADAHAWPELWFQSVGWVRFEPTPSGLDGQGTAVAPVYSLGSAAGQGTTPGGSTSTAPRAGPSGKIRTPSKIRAISGGGAAGAGHSGRNAAGFPVGIPVAAALILLLAAPGLSRWLVRRRRWMTASGDAALAHTAWRELTDFLSDYGFSGQPSESPRTLARRVSKDAELRQAATASIGRIAAAEERARYSLGTQPGGGLAADVAAVRRALAASSGRGTRLRARLLPPSIMAALASGLQSLSGATTWIDSSLPSMRRQLRRTAPHRSS